MDLKKEALEMMKQGVYDPEKLFQILYRKHAVHYSQVREAIHEAKQR